MRATRLILAVGDLNHPAAGSEQLSEGPKATYHATKPPFQARPRPVPSQFVLSVDVSEHPSLIFPR